MPNPLPERRLIDHHDLRLGYHFAREAQQVEDIGLDPPSVERLMTGLKPKLREWSAAEAFVWGLSTGVLAARSVDAP